MKSVRVVIDFFFFYRYIIDIINVWKMEIKYYVIFFMMCFQSAHILYAVVIDIYVIPVGYIFNVHTS